MYGITAHMHSFIRKGKRMNDIRHKFEKKLGKTASKAHRYLITHGETQSLELFKLNSFMQKTKRITIYIKPIYGLG